jgi:O-antigen/teichoic acid export membrane protein
MTSALFPVLSRLISTQPSAAYESMRRTLLTVLLIAMPLATGLAAIGSPLFAFLHYPPPFSHSVPILAVMCVGWILTSIVMVLGCGAMASGGQRTWALASVALLVVFAVLNLLLIPLAQRWWTNGGIGAALANVIGELTLVVVGLVLMPSHLFGWRDIFYIGRVVLACLLMAVVVRASSGLWLPLSIAAGGLTYGMFSVALRTLNIDDLKAVIRLLKSRVSTDASEPTGQTPLANASA